MDTLLLDDNWDLTLDASGNIALASSKYPGNKPKSLAYGQAQDAASQIKLFLGELYYDNAQGIPYWQQILGYIPRTPYIKTQYNQAALLVPGVVRASTQIESVNDRKVVGTVYITNNDSVQATARFNAVVGAP